ncbi:MAG: hypothetical protein NTV23_06220 [Propionibacteriales bacterium]|nr:hypothetical protein [Propionibacteriales bacterium]
MDPAGSRLQRSGAAVAGMVSSFVAFWVLVRSLAAGSDSSVRNVQLVAASVLVVLVVLALWLPRMRPIALGVVLGTLVGAGAALALAAAFGR